MQERRTTIRIGYTCRVQYCGSDDLLPRDGHLTDLSERGAGLRLREPHQHGERVTVSVALPGANDTLTASGVLHWSDAPAKGRHWYGAGVEWLPMEEAARNRLHAFLSSSAHPASAFRSAKTHRPNWFWPLQLAVALVVVLTGAWGSMSILQRMRALRQENLQLAATLHQRDSTITQLARDGQRFQEELVATKAHLSTTAEEILRLDERTQYLTGEVERLNRSTEGIQQSYFRVRQQREELTQQMLDLQRENTMFAQERAHLASRLSSVPELRLAIREALAVRRQEEEAKRQARIQVKRDAERQRALGGNQGYLVREGRPRLTQSTVWIRVHEPAPVPPVR